MQRSDWALCIGVIMLLSASLACKILGGAGWVLSLPAIATILGYLVGGAALIMYAFMGVNYDES